MKTLTNTIVLAILMAVTSSAGTVYFTAKGKTYHTDPKCMALAKSTVVLHADEKEALAHGLKPCGLEAHRKPATAKRTDNTTWGTR